ncbi:hypothetical protein BVC71_03630 [Marivivens niveibacter]|uniref:Uncharacterized protein n=1 Tax=Marivivens niveibacter TaxID=1930667 RepID=A0A251X2P4_9RHOB|nr:hypothetical protein [Marivivens niveibacter]OUD10594.1 hypothetical protein BVC71_03630 [Marivivens niveibacter]
MDLLIWIGAAVSVIGICGLLFTVVLVRKARKAATDDEDLRARLGKIIPINLGALLFSILGLMAVILGISLS